MENIKGINNETYWRCFFCEETIEEELYLRTESGDARPHYDKKWVLICPACLSKVKTIDFNSGIVTWKPDGEYPMIDKLTRYLIAVGAAL